MLYYNKSKLTQLIYSPHDAYPVAVHPNMVIQLNGYKDVDKSAFAPFDTKLFNNCGAITLHREYALGDLIQLIPICRLLKFIIGVKRVNVITSGRFRDDLAVLYPDINFLTKEWLSGDFSALKLGYIISLNGILEKDHSSKNKENSKHRTQIYADFFNLGDINNIKLDWSYARKENQMSSLLPNDKPIIGFQIRGSGCMKTLPYDMVKSIVYDLAKDYYVVLIDPDKNKGFDGQNIINLCGKLKSSQVVALLENLDLCFTMDSGVLWMCHSANCPTITFLGSTRESERISLHPQYPHKAKAIDLSKYVGCEPCFETKCRCKGKIRCMNEVNYDMIKDELLEKVKLILGV